MESFTPLASIEMMQKSHPLSFLGRRSMAPRPLSAATEFEDFDDEEYDSESTPSSLASEEQPRTPQSAGLAGFDFHFDEKSTSGPTGPHLFRLSPESISKVDDEFVLSMSPVAPIARTISSLNKAVAELDESQVRDWTPSQVASWMSEAGFDASVVEKFLTHDISGSVLLDLQFEDLKELDITSYGKRHRVMSSIKHLRNSSMISLSIPSSPAKSPRSLQRSPRPEEATVVIRSSSRRGRLQRPNEAISPAESISIVAIEQLLPKPHVCSKGEDCPKWRKQQRKIARLQEEFATEAAAPSVIGSSDALGPAGPTYQIISSETLEQVESRDSQESIRQFLNFQHINSSSSDPSPPPSNSASIASHLRSLPRLSIPLGSQDDSTPGSTHLTPMSPWRRTGRLQSALRADPFHYGDVASPVDVYRVGTPYSATDIPVTSLPEDPLNRDVSQSVPPEMRYGSESSAFITGESIQRPASTSSRRHGRPTFAPTIAPVAEAARQPPVEQHSAENVQRAGWMRKRKTTKLMRHEWEDSFFSLKGTKLAMHSDETATDKALETIDVDDFTIACSSMGSSSKLSAAFKKSILGSNKPLTTDQAFAFSLLPESKAPKAKTHHFSVKNRDERVEWMRDLMLARALHKNKASGHEVRVNGELI